MPAVPPSPLVLRPLAARLALVVLNLPVPGLGLLRVGRWRAATACLAAPFALMALFTAAMGVAPVSGYRSAVAALALIAALTASLFVVPARLTWRASRFRAGPRIWSRWYALLAVGVAALLLAGAAPALMHRFFQPFRAPSASMAPTIEVGDRFVADMRPRGAPRRGAVVLFRGADSVRVGRVVGLPGDRVAMRSGVLLVNGARARSTDPTRMVRTDEGVREAVTMLTERLPGEAGSHRVLDAGTTVLDDLGEVVVPAGHVFLLGDHRDRSADSRAPREANGAGMVAFGALVGRPLYVYWSNDRGRIGRRLDRR